MASEAAEAKYSIPIGVEYESAEQAAGALENLRAKIQGGTESLKAMQSAYNRLRGTTLEVKSAKDELKAKINAERDAISSAQLKIIQAGSSYDALAKKTRLAAAEQKSLSDKMKADAISKAKERTDALSNAVRSAGGPIAAMKDRLKSLQDAAGGGGLGLAVLGVAGLVAALVALVAAAGAAAYALGKFILVGADAARSANLLREAATGSAANAYALGTQIDALAMKVPTAKAALNDMAVSMAKSGIGGKTLVDTLNAVGQASAALGDDAGAKLREFVDRGRLTQRFAVNPLELQGTGLQFDDIAKELSISMKVGIKDARAALFEGRVQLGDGAAAMRAAVEKKFAGINLRKMLSFEGLAETFNKLTSSLTSGVNIEPLNRGLGELVGMLDESTVTGAALKEVVTLLGNGIATSFAKGVPFIQQFVKGMIIAGLQVTIAALKIRKALRDSLGDVTFLKGVDKMKLALTAGKIVITSFALGLGLVVGIIAAIVYAIDGLVIGVGWVIDGLTSLGKAAKDAFSVFDATYLNGLGASIIDGIVKGLNPTKLVDAVKGLAEKVKIGFKGALGIQSPSKVFAEYGRNTTAGFTEGVEDGTPEAARALDNMGAPPTAPSAQKSATSSSGSTVVNVNINAPGATKEAVDAMSDESFLAKVRKAILDELAGAGVVPA